MISRDGEDVGARWQFRNIYMSICLYKRLVENQFTAEIIYRQYVLTRISLDQVYINITFCGVGENRNAEVI